MGNSEKNDTLHASAAAIVKAIPLDAFYRSHLVGKTILSIKMDIEGGELGALHGASFLLQDCKVKHWSISTHCLDCFHGSLVLLQNAGYTICSNSQPPNL